MKKLTEYLQGTYEEVRKVTWPTKNETRKYTLLVIGISLAVAAFLGALDYLFNLGFEQVLK